MEVMRRGFFVGFPSAVAVKTLLFLQSRERLDFSKELLNFHGQIRYHLRRKCCLTAKDA